MSAFVEGIYGKNGKGKTDSPGGQAYLVEVVVRWW
jgi:hypothetical protein